MFSALEDLIKTHLCKSLPNALPIAHATEARWFGGIASSGRLQQTFCHVFRKDLLYLFYGGIFYRTSKGPVRDPLALPVAFLFSPAVLRHVDSYYPFDTGGMAGGRFGSWDELSPIEAKCRVAGKSVSAASEIVCCLYGDNRNYLRGTPRLSSPAAAEPLASLTRFLSTDLSHLGVDKRQCLIECQVENSLPFDGDLMWVGFPDECMPSFLKLYEGTKPWLPDFWNYDHHAVADPTEIGAQLEQEAHRIVKRFVRIGDAG